MKERFATELAAGSLADAYLFVGASRSRLKEVAFDCAKVLLGAHGPLAEHADFSLFDPVELGVPGLKVEHVAYRKDGVPCLETALRYRPKVGDFRAVVLLDADRMTTDAQGALLKTTEEPPPGTILFFTACELYDLSPALRSRCRIWRVARKAEEELMRQASAAGIAAADWQVLKWACGSGERVLEMPKEERQILLDAFPAVQAWLQGEGSATDWCQVPAAAKMSEKRRLSLLLLGAVWAWLCSGQKDPELGNLAFQDHWSRRLDVALGRLSGQVTPELVFQDFLQNP